MKIYLDTGNINEISLAASSFLIDGVTTNPSLISKEGVEFEKQLKEIVKILKSNLDEFTISAELRNTTNYQEIVNQAKKLSKIDKSIIVKIPICEEGLKATKILSKDGIKCNLTLCFSSNQALLAAKAGAWCVSPFVGRIEDEGWRGIELIEDIRKIYDKYNFKTKILAASIRSAEHVSECAKIGADIATMPYSVFKKLYYNPLTVMGIDIFEKDWQIYEENLKLKNKT